MELTQTITLLENRKTALQSELEAINLALSILKSEYEPELKVIENANKEIATLKSEKDTLSSVKTQLEKTLSDKEVELSTLKTAPVIETVKEEVIEPVLEEVITE